MRHHRSLAAAVVGGLLVSTPVETAIIRVPTDQPTIQAGIDVAAAGDEVVVDCGRYEEHLTLKSGVTVRSTTGSADCVVVDATIWAHVASVIGLTDVTMRGLTLMNGGGYGINGGGIFARSSRLKLQDCLVEANVVTTGSGGGAKLEDSDVEVDGCTFQGNAARLAGGGLSAEGGTLVVRSSMFRFNTAVDGYSHSGRGGAIRLARGVEATFDDVAFTANLALLGGGAVYLEGESSSIFRSCRFERNHADDASIGEIRAANGTFEHCVFVSNGRSESRSGIWSEATSVVRMSESTVYGTRSTADFWAVHGGQVAVERSLFAFNEAANLFHCVAPVGLEITCCDLFGNTGVEFTGCAPVLADIFHADPLFCGAAGEDLRLHQGSPCLAENSPCGQSVGARTVGCAATAAGEPFEAIDWGRIKTLYR